MALKDGLLDSVNHRAVSRAGGSERPVLLHPVLSPRGHRPTLHSCPLRDTGEKRCGSGGRWRLKLTQRRSSSIRYATRLSERMSAGRRPCIPGVHARFHPFKFNAIAIAANNSAPVSDITPAQPALAQNRPPADPAMLDPR
jgi:hypothetical protein